MVDSLNVYVSISDSEYNMSCYGLDKMWLKKGFSVIIWAADFLTRYYGVINQNNQREEKWIANGPYSEVSVSTIDSQQKEKMNSIDWVNIKVCVYIQQLFVVKGGPLWV